VPSIIGVQIARGRGRYNARPVRRFALAFAFLILATALDASASTAIPGDATPIRLQLKWRHQFQFAGYYAALEKGYYRDAGFDVTIVPASPATDPVDVVLKGGADFGIASSELVLRYAKGDPVVVLATIFQHSPLTLFVARRHGQSSPCETSPVAGSRSHPGKRRYSPTSSASRCRSGSCNSYSTTTA
jgi:hypothetical protein